jgi:predicted transposase YdaD
MYLEGKFFEMLFERAGIANFTPQEVMKYERDMLTQWNIDGLRETVRHEARAEGFAEGRAEGRAKGLVEGREEGLVKEIDKGRSESLAMVARNLLKSGMKPEAVAYNTTLSVEKVLEIQKSL